MKWMHMLATVSLLAAATASFAQVGARPQIYSDVVPPDRGTAEVGLSLDAKLDKPSGQTFNVRFLPYLNRQIQVGAALTYTHFSGFSGGFLEALANYNFVASPSEDFATKRTVPYVGVGLGTSFGDANGSDYGLQGGVKHFLTNDVSLFGEINYRHFSENIDTDKNETRLLIGINTYLRS